MCEIRSELSGPCIEQFVPIKIFEKNKPYLIKRTSGELLDILELVVLINDVNR